MTGAISKAARRRARLCRNAVLKSQVAASAVLGHLFQDSQDTAGEFVDPQASSTTEQLLQALTVSDMRADAPPFHPSRMMVGNVVSPCETHFFPGLQDSNRKVLGAEQTADALPHVQVPCMNFVHVVEPRHADTLSSVLQGYVSELVTAVCGRVAVHDFSNYMLSPTWFSTTEPSGDSSAGCAGASTTEPSMHSKAGDAGASTTEPSMQSKAGDAGASTTEPSGDSSAGCAGASTTEPSMHSKAGDAGASTTEPSMQSKAGDAGASTSEPSGHQNKSVATCACFVESETLTDLAWGDDSIHCRFIQEAGLLVSPTFEADLSEGDLAVYGYASHYLEYLLGHPEWWTPEALQAGSAYAFA